MSDSFTGKIMNQPEYIVVKYLTYNDCLNPFPMNKFVPNGNSKLAYT